MPDSYYTDNLSQMFQEDWGEYGYGNRVADSHRFQGLDLNQVLALTESAFTNPLEVDFGLSRANNNSTFYCLYCTIFGYFLQGFSAIFSCLYCNIFTWNF